MDKPQEYLPSSHSAERNTKLENNLDELIEYFKDFLLEQKKLIDEILTSEDIPELQEQANTLMVLLDPTQAGSRSLAKLVSVLPFSQRKELLDKAKEYAAEEVYYPIRQLVGYVEGGLGSKIQYQEWQNAGQINADEIKQHKGEFSPYDMSTHVFQQSILEQTLVEAAANARDVYMEDTTGRFGKGITSNWQWLALHKDARFLMLSKNYRQESTGVRLRAVEGEFYLATESQPDTQLVEESAYVYAAFGVEHQFKTGTLIKVEAPMDVEGLMAEINWRFKDSSGPEIWCIKHNESPVIINKEASGLVPLGKSQPDSAQGKVYIIVTDSGYVVLDEGAGLASGDLSAVEVQNEKFLSPGRSTKVYNRNDKQSKAELLTRVDSSAGNLEVSIQVSGINVETYKISDKVMASFPTDKAVISLDTVTIDESRTRILRDAVYEENLAKIVQEIAEINDPIERIKHANLLASALRATASGVKSTYTEEYKSYLAIVAGKLRPLVTPDLELIQKEGKIKVIPNDADFAHLDFGEVLYVDSDLFDFYPANLGSYAPNWEGSTSRRACLTEFKSDEDFHPTHFEYEGILYFDKAIYERLIADNKGRSLMNLMLLGLVGYKQPAHIEGYKNKGIGHFRYNTDPVSESQEPENPEQAATLVPDNEVLYFLASVDWNQQFAEWQNEEVEIRDALKYIEWGLEQITNPDFVSEHRPSDELSIKDFLHSYLAFLKTQFPILETHLIDPNSGPTGYKNARDLHQYITNMGRALANLVFDTPWNFELSWCRELAQEYMDLVVAICEHGGQKEEVRLMNPVFWTTDFGRSLSDKYVNSVPSLEWRQSFGEVDNKIPVLAGHIAMVRSITNLQDEAAVAYLTRSLDLYAEDPESTVALIESILWNYKLNTTHPAFMQLQARAIQRIDIDYLPSISLEAQKLFVVHASNLFRFDLDYESKVVQEMISHIIEILKYGIISDPGNSDFAGAINSFLAEVKFEGTLPSNYLTEIVQDLISFLSINYTGPQRHLRVSVMSGLLENRSLSKNTEPLVLKALEIVNSAQQSFVSGTELYVLDRAYGNLLANPAVRDLSPSTVTAWIDSLFEQNSFYYRKNTLEVIRRCDLGLFSEAQFNHLLADPDYSEDFPTVLNVLQNETFSDLNEGSVIAALDIALSKLKLATAEPVIPDLTYLLARLKSNIEYANCALSIAVADKYVELFEQILHMIRICMQRQVNASNQQQLHDLREYDLRSGLGNMIRSLSYSKNINPDMYESQYFIRRILAVVSSYSHLDESEVDRGGYADHLLDSWVESAVEPTEEMISVLAKLEAAGSTEVGRFVMPLPGKYVNNVFRIPEDPEVIGNLVETVRNLKWLLNHNYSDLDFVNNISIAQSDMGWSNSLLGSNVVVGMLAYVGAFSKELAEMVTSQLEAGQIGNFNSPYDMYAFAKILGEASKLGATDFESLIYSVNLMMTSPALGVLFEDTVQDLLFSPENLSAQTVETLQFLAAGETISEVRSKSEISRGDISGITVGEMITRRSKGADVFDTGIIVEPDTDAITKAVHSQSVRWDIFMRELLQNARDAVIMATGGLASGQIDIEFYKEKTSEEESGVVSLKDNGIGMDLEVIKSKLLQFNVRDVEKASNPLIEGGIGWGFGSVIMVADEIDLITVKNGQETKLRLGIVRENGLVTDIIIIGNEIRQTTSESGTEILVRLTKDLPPAWQGRLVKNAVEKYARPLAGQLAVAYQSEAIGEISKTKIAEIKYSGSAGLSGPQTGDLTVSFTSNQDYPWSHVSRRNLPLGEVEDGNFGLLDFVHPSIVNMIKKRGLVIQVDLPKWLPPTRVRAGLAVPKEEIIRLKKVVAAAIYREVAEQYRKGAWAVTVMANDSLYSQGYVPDRSIMEEAKLMGHAMNGETELLDMFDASKYVSRSLYAVQHLIMNIPLKDGRTLNEIRRAMIANPASASKSGTPFDADFIRMYLSDGSDGDWEKQGIDPETAQIIYNRAKATESLLGVDVEVAFTTEPRSFADGKKIYLSTSLKNSGIYNFTGTYVEELTHVLEHTLLRHNPDSASLARARGFLKYVLPAEYGAYIGGDMALAELFAKARELVFMPKQRVVHMQTHTESNETPFRFISNVIFQMLVRRFDSTNYASSIL